MRGPVDEQPREPGWWLASDGKWYPPERPPPKFVQQVPARRFFDPSERPPLIVLGAVFGLGLVAGWVAMGWNLGAVDESGNHVDFFDQRPVPLTAFALGAALLAVCVMVASWIHPSSWKWIGASAVAAVEGWFLWRAYSTPTSGANMAPAGAVFLLPFVIGVAFPPAWGASRIRGLGVRRGA